jgi:anti-anti-sigma factor
LDPEASAGASPCRHCGHALWFRLREGSGFVVLRLLPQTGVRMVDIVPASEAFVRNGRAQRVIVDFTVVRTATSRFFGCLFSLHKRLQEIGGRLILCGANPAVRDVLRIMKLDTIFEIADTVEDAIARP